MKRVLILVGLLSITLGANAWATEDGPGCGLGKQLFKGQSGLVPQVLAWLINGTFSGTSAMTTGTSGCKADSVILHEYEQNVFVASNLGVLNQEMAQGQGQHVAALASLMGCPASTYGEFAQMSQETYGTVFASADVEAGTVLASLKQELGQRPALAASCSRIS
jgi:hypothetical protein